MHYELEGDDKLAREESQAWDVDSNVDMSEGETESLSKINGRKEKKKFRNGITKLILTELT